MIKRKTKGKEGTITSYAFQLFGKPCIIAVSETKWHKGDKFRRTPIWTGNIGGEIPALFIWHVAFGYQKKKEDKCDQ